MFSDYIVYVDESGDHGLRTIDPEFPYFVLAFCIFRKSTYLQAVVPAVQDLKFRYFGHDIVVLHESDIRKSRGPFSILLNESVRTPFMEDLKRIVSGAQFSVVASCIDKLRFLDRRGGFSNPYHVALEFGMERVFYELVQNDQRNRKCHVVFEKRGRHEDDELELEFRRILDRSKIDGLGSTLDIVMANKQVNSAGLQIADMVARPIARHLIDPTQANRAYDVISAKLRTNPEGNPVGWGLKVYP